MRESNNILKTLVTARKERNGNFVRNCDGDHYRDDGDTEQEEEESCCCCWVRAALEYYLHDGTSDTF